MQFSVANYDADEAAGNITITVNRSGDTSAPATVEYGTFDLGASERRDYTTAVGTLRFAPGETTKTFLVFITDDAYVEGTETLSLNLSNPIGVNLGIQSSSTVTIIDNDGAPTSINPIDDTHFYVRHHYVDFLNREPDSDGLAFWMNQITSCGSDASCAEVKHINVSAAYFLSIEFQQTGYMVYLLQKASFGNMPRYRQFMGDTQEIGRGIIVGAPGWEAQLDANKAEFVDRWINRPAFKTQFDGMSDSQFVDALFLNAGIVNTAERDSMVAGLQGSSMTRSAVIRQLIQDQAFSQKEFNSAFVLMQYFGYLRRNPDDAPDNNLDGFNFWLNKLNQFNGDYIAAEMVKAFITSIEYRQRFGQP